MTLVSTVGGAAGPLYGTFFLEFGKAAGERTSLSAEDWAAALSAATAGVQARGKAEAGDKTMVDALLPARDALDGGRRSRRAPGRSPARGGRRGRRRHARDDPAGRAQGSRQLSGGAQRGSSGPRRDELVVAAGDGRRRTWRSGGRRGRPGVAVVGLVVVSHSARLAEGVAELAAQMAGPEVRIGAAGGLDEPVGALGTDAVKVLAAIEDVWSDDGVLVLMDLGSAVLSAELAVDLLAEERRGRVLLTSAPLVEGAVAAAVAAGLGDPLETVAAAARDGLAAKREHLEEPEDDRADDRPVAVARGRSGARAADRGAGAGGRQRGPAADRHVTVRNRLGLHARPAALLVRTLAPLDARVTLAVPARGRGPADARSLTAVGGLGVRCGDAGARERERSTGDGGAGDDAPAGRRGVRRARRPRRAGRRLPGGAGGRGRTPALDAAGGAPALEPPAAGTVLAGVPAAPGVALGPARLPQRPPLTPAPLGSPRATPTWSGERWRRRARP